MPGRLRCACRSVLAFAAPQDGSYVVRLEYPKCRFLTLLAVTALVVGTWLLSRREFPNRTQIPRIDADHG